MKAFIHQWFTPQSDDPNLVFREKSLRLFLGVIIPLGVLFFATSFMVWRGTFTPASRVQLVRSVGAVWLVDFDPDHLSIDDNKRRFAPPG